jgi:hexosaminidase
MDPVIDLGAPTDVKRVVTHFLNSKVAWIYPPRNIAVYISDDGVLFKFLKNKAIDAQNLGGSTVETVVLDVPGSRGRYLKVVAQTYGVIPPDAPGAGEGSWLFLDEIVVE